ncbi:MAG TPA: hypothetical protein VFV81_07020 [Verrucomicrobiae bacterium]|nr:hypothetical protein [Verrucomicrobiae bacterium]
MNADFANFFRDLWDSKPGIVVLLVGGAILFLLLVIDTFRHRRKLKERHRLKHPDR